MRCVIWPLPFDRKETAALPHPPLTPVTPLQAPSWPTHLPPPAWPLPLSDTHFLLHNSLTSTLLLLQPQEEDFALTSSFLWNNSPHLQVFADCLSSQDSARTLSSHVLPERCPALLANGHTRKATQQVPGVGLQDSDEQAFPGVHRSQVLCRAQCPRQLLQFSELAFAVSLSPLYRREREAQRGL